MNKLQKALFASLMVLIVLLSGLFGYWIGREDSGLSVASVQTSDDNQSEKHSQSLAPNKTITSNHTQVPTRTLEPTPPQPDFLDNADNLYNLNLVLKNYEFQSYLDSVNNYISSSNPSDTDNAYVIKECLAQVIESLKLCDLNHDEFDDSYTIYYKGIDSIGKSVNIVPVMEDRSLRFRVGFKKSDWLFFDTISLKPNTGDNITDYFDSWDIERDVLRGGITEYTDTSFYDDELVQILNSSSITMRFINSENDKYYEHELSNDEMAACKTLITIDQALQALVDLTFYKH